MGAYTDYWVIPGGGIDEGETKLEAARRETLEEVGIDISAFKSRLLEEQWTDTQEKTLRNTGEKITVAMTFYVVVVKADKVANDIPVRCGDDIVEASWHSVATLDDLSIPSVTKAALHSIGLLRTLYMRRFIRAPRAAVYQALLDPAAIAKWKVPDGMTMQIHSFDARPGGTFRISLTYHDNAQAGKTAAHTDTYHGQFTQVIPNEKVVEQDEFETNDPELQGKMTATITLADKDDGTLLEAIHANVPPGVRPADNDLGWRMSLDKLTALVEKDHQSAVVRSQV